MAAESVVAAATTGVRSDGGETGAEYAKIEEGVSQQRVPALELFDQTLLPMRTCRPERRLRPPPRRLNRRPYATDGRIHRTRRSGVPAHRSFVTSPARAVNTSRFKARSSLEKRSSASSCWSKRVEFRFSPLSNNHVSSRRRNDTRTTDGRHLHGAAPTARRGIFRSRSGDRQRLHSPARPSALNSTAPFPSCERPHRGLRCFHHENRAAWSRRCADWAPAEFPALATPAGGIFRGAGKDFRRCSRPGDRRRNPGI